MEISNKILIAVLKNIIEELGLITQQELAKAAGISQSSISGYINGSGKPKRETKLKIIKGLKDKLKYKDEDIINEGHKLISIQDESNEPSYDKEPKTVIEIHQDIITKFKNPEEGLSGNQALLKIEKLNERLFYRVISDLKYMAKKIEEGIEPEPLIIDTNYIKMKNMRSKKERSEKKTSKKEQSKAKQSDKMTE